MNIIDCPLPGLMLVEPDPISDARGSFSLSYDEAAFRARGLNTTWVQSNISVNRRRGTLRGMHFQRTPHEQIKLVRCTRGVIVDVALDLRRDSPTYKRWFEVELSAENQKALYVPKGFAHGFQSLTDDSEVLYQMGGVYVPEAASVVRWDDPAFGIEWPLPDPILSEKDATCPFFSE